MGTARHLSGRAPGRAALALIAAFAVIGTGCGGSDDEAAAPAEEGVSAEECVSMLRSRYADPANPPSDVDPTEAACRRAGFDPVWEEKGIEAVAADYYEHFGVSAPSEGTAAAPAGAPDPTPAPTEAPAAPPAVMPDVVCMNLQDAQDLIQEAGVFFSDSFDATGQGRMQVVDSNWVVVSQDPAPGTPIGEGDANLGAVKYGEPNDC